MNYAEIKAQLRGLINRSDMTDELAESFVRRAQTRLERLLRLSFMQKFVTFNPPREDGVFRVPSDYLQMISLFHDSGQLDHVETSRFLEFPTTTGTASVYMQTGHDIRMRPCPPTDATLSLQYFGCEPALVTNEQSNSWTISASDALIYGAAIYAADYFEDERSVLFSNQFSGFVKELQDQQLQEDFSGPLSIQPAYSIP